MGFKVDTEVVRDSVGVLRQLLEECEEIYRKEIPDSSVDKGLTHVELQEVCQNIKITCQYLGELINNSIRFLGEASDMFDTSDKESATKIDTNNTQNENVGNSTNSKETVRYPNMKAYSGSNEEYKNYSTVNCFNEKYLYNQNNYSDFVTSNGNVGCAATAEAMAYSMYNDTQLEPDKLDQYGKNWLCDWKYCKEYKGNLKSQQDVYGAIYGYLSENKPAVFGVRVGNEYTIKHYLVAVGISNDADINNLTAKDILVVNPWDAKVTTLEEYTNKYGKAVNMCSDGTYQAYVRSV